MSSDKSRANLLLGMSWYISFEGVQCKEWCKNKIGLFQSLSAKEIEG